MMKIGVISDTHGEAGLTEQAIHTLDRLDAQLILHCGDIGLDVVPLFHGRSVHFVSGNIDDTARLRETITEPGHTFHESFGDLTIEGRRVAFLHGDDVKLLHHTIHDGHWDLVCHGHTHAFSTCHEGRTLVLNPGALSRTHDPSVALVDVASLDVTKISF